jgi:hypothetical protein
MEAEHRRRLTAAEGAEVAIEVVDELRRDLAERLVLEAGR